MDLITVKGIDRTGESREVSFAASPRDLASALAGDGWRYASLTTDGYLVGEVFPLSAAHRIKTWWSADRREGLPVTPHVHEWEPGAVGCDDCGEHDAVYCEGCDTLIDLVREDDPREVS